MPEVICNTSPLQSLHQLGLLNILPTLVGRMTVPPAVKKELREGIAVGIDLPNISELGWIQTRSPTIARPQLLIDLGPGEAEVLMLAQEVDDPVVILDDRLARRVPALSS